VDHAWITADDCLERYNRGDMMMAPPTVATLADVQQTFARYSSLPAMLEGERRRSVPPILPKLLVANGEATVVLPWDPEYARLGGEACFAAAGYPERLTRQPSRRTLPLPATRPR
jgi:hypothetical protein